MNFSMISVQPAKSYLSGPCAGRLKEHTLDKRRKCEYFVISSSVHPGLNENLFWCAIINQNVHSWNLIPKDGCRGDAESTQNMKGRKYMPTERFEKLPEYKKQRIGRAIMEELRETSYHQLHLTKIARTASVSRASLYCYFKNKDDMLLFSLFLSHMEFFDGLKGYLAECGGNFWKMLELGLERYLAPNESGDICGLFYSPEGNRDLARYFPLYMGEKWFQDHKDWSYVNCTNQEIKHSGPEMFDTIQEVCYGSLFISLHLFFTGRMKKKDIMEKFSQ